MVEQKNNSRAKKPNIKGKIKSQNKVINSKPKKAVKPKNSAKKNNTQKTSVKKQVVKNLNVKKVKEIKISKSKKETNKNLKIRFLGGVGEIGKNMTALEYGSDIIIIDAGITFPDENMPGVDVVIPDFSYLEQNKNKIKGIIITHGHEDHIGSVPYLLKDFNVPVYGTKLTLTLIESKIKEHKINDAILNCITPGSTIKLGSFSVEFINVNHSIAGAVGLAITMPLGIVFHSGDFKIDYTPVNGESIDLTRIAEIGKQGVLLMMADSTNIEIEGTTMSEAVVKDTLDHVFSNNIGRRLIIATFASNVHRLQQILDLAIKHKRKVAFSGRSMINIAEASAKIGELNIADKLIVDIDKVGNYKDGEIVIVSTGTQGEPMSALTRMASGEFNKVKIGENDTVVISASVIPGNEKMIYAVINNLYRLGAEVIYSSLEPIHVSGHACRDELKILHTLVKPKFFIPVHGEYRHLKKHAKLAESVGVKKHNILIAEIGDTVELTSNTIKHGERFVAGSRFVDGLGIDSADSTVIRDRLHLSADGLLVVAVCIDEFSRELRSINVKYKGIVLNDSINKEIEGHILSAFKQVDIRKVKDQAELENYVKRSIKNYVFKAIKKNPVILPIVVVV